MELCLPDLIINTQNIKATIHAIERIPLTRSNGLSQLIPIRFLPMNKLSRWDKVKCGFDAIALSRFSGEKINLTKIIHGDKWSTFKLKTKDISREFNKIIGKITQLLSAESPPDLILNKHCPECVFRDRCKMKAIEKDYLGLLTNLPENERRRLKNKGIFAVNQLSYTFRPRRRSKRLVTKPEKYHYSLKALAIRDKKIYITGSPQLQIEGTPVYFDVERYNPHMGCI